MSTRPAPGLGGERPGPGGADRLVGRDLPDLAGFRGVLGFHRRPPPSAAGRVRDRPGHLPDRRRVPVRLPVFPVRSAPRPHIRHRSGDHGGDGRGTGRSDGHAALGSGVPHPGIRREGRRGGAGLPGAGRRPDRRPPDRRCRLRDGAGRDRDPGGGPVLVAAGDTVRGGGPAGRSLHRPRRLGGRSSRCAGGSGLVHRGILRSLYVVGGSGGGQPLHLVPGPQSPARRVGCRSPAAPGRVRRDSRRGGAAVPPPRHRRRADRVAREGRRTQALPDAGPPAPGRLAAVGRVRQDTVGPPPLDLGLGGRSGLPDADHVRDLAVLFPGYGGAREPLDRPSPGGVRHVRCQQPRIHGHRSRFSLLPNLSVHRPPHGHHLRRQGVSTAMVRENTPAPSTCCWPIRLPAGR